jgi:ribose transport system substrate-binding protein
MSPLLHSPRRVSVACAAIAAALAISACGSSSKSSTASSSSGGAATTAGSSSSSSSSGSSVLSSAKAQISQYSPIPKFKATGPKVDASKLSGKKILVVDNDQVAQELVTINQGVTQAAAAAHLKVSFFNGQDTLSTDQQGINQGISQKVAAIILDGVDPALVPSSMKAAKAAGIPIVAATLGTTKDNPDVFGTSSPDYVLMGNLMADAAVVGNSGGKITADVVQFTNPTVPQALSGVKSVFSKCSSSCTISKSDTIEPQDWPTKVAPTVVADVKANPDVNVIFGVVDDTMGNFAATGVKEAAVTNVKVIAGQGSGPAPLATVQQGGAYYADPGQSALWTGWGAVDQAMRGILGMQPGTDVTPIRYLDATTLKGVNVKDSTAIYGDSYVSGFKTLWGLSG